MIPPPFRLFRFFYDYDQKLGSVQTAPHIASSDFIGIFGLFLTKNFPKNTTGHISTFFFYIKKSSKSRKSTETHTARRLPGFRLFSIHQREAGNIGGKDIYSIEGGRARSPIPKGKYLFSLKRISK
ncbi:hypothetical protein CCP4SC76_2660006 [Gammaproteobacteria bacterium]